jgi:hypothetical protein
MFKDIFGKNNYLPFINNKYRLILYRSFFILAPVGNDNRLLAEFVGK